LFNNKTLHLFYHNIKRTHGKEGTRRFLGAVTGDTKHLTEGLNMNTRAFRFATWKKPSVSPDFICTWECTAEKSNLLRYRYQKRSLHKILHYFYKTTLFLSFLFQGKDNPYLPVSGAALFGAKSSTKYAILSSV